MNSGSKIRGLTTILLLVLLIYTLCVVLKKGNEMEEISYEEESDGHKKDTWLSAKDTTLTFTCKNITDIDVIMFIAGGTWMSSYLGVYKTYKNSNIFVLRTIRNNKVK